jgi:carbonic anhydrase
MERNGGAVLLALVTTLAACGDARPPAADHNAAATSAVRPVHWGYAGEEGPAHWADLSPDYSQCRDGTRQSPIDLVATATDTSAVFSRVYHSEALSIAFNEQAVDLLDNGHTIQVNYEGGDTLTVDGAAYALRQFHFHAPSEHTLAGQHLPLEVHLVHQASNGGLAVLGVFFTAGAEHPGLANLLAQLPTPGAELHFDEMVVRLDWLIPEEDRFYRYDGSLTTPPCSEGVSWIVMAQPIGASAAQLDSIAGVLGGNNRPVQLAGEREVLLVAH